VVLRNLFRVYSDLRIQDHSVPDAADEDESHPVTAIIDSIEKCWIKADQDLFIACLFLNLMFKLSLFNPQKMPVAILTRIIQRLYLRVFQVTVTANNFMKDVVAYHAYQGQFSEHNWPIDELKEGL
jgi:hypothetical protein